MSNTDLVYGLVCDNCACSIWEKISDTEIKCLGCGFIYEFNENDTNEE